jgi:hypothetical protein
MWESGNFAKAGEKLLGSPPPQWSSLLVGAAFPPRWGLYVEPPEGQFETVAGEFEVIPLVRDDGNGILAARFKLARIPFTLILGAPDHPEAWGIYRPKGICLENEGARHLLRFTWPEGQSGEAVVYTRIGEAPAD